MCFINNCSWTAEVQEEWSALAEKPTYCEECRRPIPAKAMVHYLEQQEHEECQACVWGDCACPDRTDDFHYCVCAEPEFGELFEWRCCDDCCRFLKVIEAAEMEAGCAASESRPMLGEMIESLREAHADLDRYLEAAQRLHPELQANGYLEWLRRRIRWED
jgi:hypothetical protein